MSITIVIVGVTVLVSFIAWQQPNLYHKSLFNPYQIASKGEYYRFISSGLIHDGWMHLGFNMFTFFFFGQNVEYIYGRIAGDNSIWLFLGLYVGAIIVSDLPNYFKYRNSPGYNSLGASGGVSAVVFASILFMPLNDICLYGFICIPGFILGILYILYSVYQGKTMSDNINHQAHLVGALYGVIFSLIVEPSAFMRFISQISSYRIF